MNQEGDTGAGQSQTGYQYSESNTTKKPSFKWNITKLKHYIFKQGHPFDAVKYEEYIKTLINYVQLEYSASVWLRQENREVKVPNLVLTIKPTKDNNTRVKIV